MAFEWIVNLDAKDWIVVASTLAGPILAVQAQKAVEAFRARRDRKMSIFATLMATRKERLSSIHVQALNGIDVVFYGRRILGLKWRRASEQAVLDKWKEYLYHLSTGPVDAGWGKEADRRFVNLLEAIATDVGITFDRVQLETGAYSPTAHGNIEDEQNLARRLLIAVLKGDQPLSLKVVSLPDESGATVTSAPTIQANQPPKMAG